MPVAHAVKASAASATMAAPSSLRRAPSSTSPTARAVSAWISAIRSAIVPAAAWDSSASWRTSLGDDREATALVAGAGGLDRRVQCEQVRLRCDRGDRVDDAPMRSERCRGADRSTASRGARTASIATAARRPLARRRRRSPAPPGGQDRVAGMGRRRRRPPRRPPRPSAAAPPRLAPGARRRGHVGHGRGDLAAARPASPEVAASWPEAALSVPAVPETSPTISRRRRLIVRSARPSVSRSERGCASRLRSPRRSPRPPGLLAQRRHHPRRTRRPSGRPRPRPRAPPRRRGRRRRSARPRRRSPAPGGPAGSPRAPVRPRWPAGRPARSGSASCAAVHRGEHLVLGRDGGERPAAGRHRGGEDHDVAVGDGINGFDRPVERRQP